MLRVYAQAAIAAAAMPVVGFITGKVVGEAMAKFPLLAVVGVVVYAVALAASYAHLRHYYARFDGEGVRASPFIAFAVEVATFYLSFASVVLGSAWALWGSLIGAGVVFWGNLTSMSLGLAERKRSVDARAPAAFPVGEPQEVNGAVNAVEPRREEREEALPVPLEKEELSLLGALEVPKGPSALARELGWPKSTVAKRLQRLVSRGLVEARDGVYRRTERASV
ncbi:helix-turn-helix transcriptional regulator [Thermus thalpophilus]|uniref:helix-turn-helix transcriptional regulator n=1 Tax=Thermus thalpophilus TaxID=2908147 RepID=UPI001FA9A4AA